MPVLRLLFIFFGVSISMVEGCCCTAKGVGQKVAPCTTGGKTGDECNVGGKKGTCQSGGTYLVLIFVL